MDLDASSTSNGTTRRRLLQAGAVGLVTGLAGCIEEMGTEFPPNKEWPISERVPDLPVEERSDVLEEQIAKLADTEIGDPENLETALDEYGLVVESIERERDVLTLEYTNTNHRDRGDLHDIGLIAGGYAALVDSGYDTTALGATILDDAPESYGSASIETSWATAYNEGAWTAAEYGELVTGSIESQRYEPEVDVDPEE